MMTLRLLALLSFTAAGAGSIGESCKGLSSAVGLPNPLTTREREGEREKQGQMEKDHYATSRGSLNLQASAISFMPPSPLSPRASRWQCAAVGRRARQAQGQCGALHEHLRDVGHAHGEGGFRGPCRFEPAEAEDA